MIHGINLITAINKIALAYNFLFKCVRIFILSPFNLKLIYGTIVPFKCMSHLNVY